MKTKQPIFEEKMIVLYKKFKRVTPAGRYIYNVVFQRKGGRIDFDISSPSFEEGDLLKITFTRKPLPSWDFVFISYDYIETDSLNTGKEYYRSELRKIDYNAPLGENNIQISGKEEKTNVLSINKESVQAVTDFLYSSIL